MIANPVAAWADEERRPERVDFRGEEDPDAALGPGVDGVGAIGELKSEESVTGREAGFVPRKVSPQRGETTGNERRGDREIVYLFDIDDPVHAVVLPSRNSTMESVGFIQHYQCIFEDTFSYFHVLP